jgi:predicted transcriptional regulator
LRIFITRNSQLIRTFAVIIKDKDMTIISSREFAAHQKKYYDTAINEDVFIKRGRNTFQLVHANGREEASHERVYHEPDEDFYRSISMDEFKERALEMVKRIDKMYAKNESNHIAGGS